MKRLLVFLALTSLLAGCGPNSSTHGVEKDIAIKVNITNHGAGHIVIATPLGIESAYDTAQETANVAKSKPVVTIPDLKLPDITMPDIPLPDVTKPDVVVPTTPTTPTTPDTPNTEEPTKPDEPPVIEPPVVPGKPEAPEPGALGPAKAILWKPVAESGGKLAVLLPADMGTPPVSVTERDGTPIENGRFVYLSNPNRATYRFTKPGKDYPNPCLLKVSNTFYWVQSPEKRLESLPSYKFTTGN